MPLPPVQLCLHTGLPSDPDQRDSQSDDFDIKLLAKFVARWMPELEPRPSIVEKCYYTVSYY